MKNSSKNKNSGSRQQHLKKQKSEKAGISVPSGGTEDKPERIAKRIARAGLCSRRDAEKWITDGRVKLNGKLLDSPAVTVTLKDQIIVDGKELPGRERTRLWLYHKPAGLLTTNKDPENRPTIYEKLPSDLPRLLSVGRLDMNTEGLLLMTNDGGLARMLELPTTGWLRRYRVRAHGKVDQQKLDSLKDGIAVDGVLYGSAEATIDREQGSNTWITISIREGKNREVKNILGAIGLDVNRLIRISYGPFQLGELPVGEIIEIKGRVLRDQLGARLIEESGADFDAPLLHDKSDKKNQGNRRSNTRPKQDQGTRKPDKGKKSSSEFSRGEMSEGTRDRLMTRRSVQEKPDTGRRKSTRSGQKPGKKFR